MSIPPPHSSSSTTPSSSSDSRPRHPPPSSPPLQNHSLLSPLPSSSHSPSQIIPSSTSVSSSTTSLPMLPTSSSASASASASDLVLDMTQRILAIPWDRLSNTEIEEHMAKFKVFRASQESVRGGKGKGKGKGKKCQPGNEEVDESVERGIGSGSGSVMETGTGIERERNSPSETTFLATSTKTPSHNKKTGARARERAKTTSTSIATSTPTTPPRSPRNTQIEAHGSTNSNININTDTNTSTQAESDTDADENTATSSSFPSTPKASILNPLNYSQIYPTRRNQEKGATTTKRQLSTSPFGDSVSLEGLSSSSSNTKPRAKPNTNSKPKPKLNSNPNSCTPRRSTLNSQTVTGAVVEVKVGASGGGAGVETETESGEPLFPPSPPRSFVVSRSNSKDAITNADNDVGTGTNTEWNQRRSKGDDADQPSSENITEGRKLRAFSNRTREESVLLGYVPAEPEHAEEGVRREGEGEGEAGSWGEEEGSQHPMAVMTRMVKTLVEENEALRNENAVLRQGRENRHGGGTEEGKGEDALEVGAGKVRERGKSTSTGRNTQTLRKHVDVDAVSLHDSINEAISTSLDVAEVDATESRPYITSPQTDHGFKTGQLNESLLMPSTKTRQRSRSGVQRLRPPSIDSLGGSVANQESTASTSWSDTLKNWGFRTGSSRPRASSTIPNLVLNHESNSKSVTFLPTGPRPSVREHRAVAGVVSNAQEEDEGEGQDGKDLLALREKRGSSPAFNAIFLATRLITPDPFSVSTPSSSLKIASMAHDLVEKARENGIAVTKPRSRRGSANSNSLAADPARSRPVNGSIAGSHTKVSSDHASGSPRAETEGVARKALLKTLSGLPRSQDPKIHTAELKSSSGHSTPVTPGITVELNSIIAPQERPPTMLLRRKTLNDYMAVNSVEPVNLASQYKDKDLTPYTDRYGFVYDMRYVRMLLDLQHAADNLAEGLPNTHPRQESMDQLPTIRVMDDQDKSPILISTAAIKSDSSTPNDEDEVRFLPSPPKPVSGSHDLHVSSQGSRSLQPTLTSDRVFSATLRSKAAKLDRLASESKTPVTALLSQLTDVHDRQEEDRMKQWSALLKAPKKSLHFKRLSTNIFQTPVNVSTSGDTFGDTPLIPRNAEARKQFRRLVRKTGIPIAMRDRIWAECSGAKEAYVPGEYQEIISIHKEDEHPVLGEIDKDVRRTFPNNIFFGGDGVGCEKLRRLLTAYAWHDPSIGYCQGMNLVAATLLLTCEDEEKAYWIFHCILTTMLPEDWFSPDLTGSMAEQDVLNEYVGIMLPNVTRHLNELGLELSAITFGWLLSIFTSCLPIETLLRVWDCFMVEGRNVIIRTAIAILKLGEDGILACDNVSDLFDYLNRITERLWTADKLTHMEHQLKATITDEDLARKRAYYANERQPVHDTRDLS